MTTTSQLPSDFQKQAFYTPDELSQMLRVHVSTVREWIRTGQLFTYRLSERVVRIPLTSVMEMFGERQPVTHRTLTEAEENAVWTQSEAEHCS
jgi:excisionase family DNA binding protein